MSKHHITLTEAERNLLIASLQFTLEKSTPDAVRIDEARQLLANLGEGKLNVPAPRDPSGLLAGVQRMLTANADLEGDVLFQAKLIVDAAWREKVNEWLEARAQLAVAYVIFLGL